MELNPVPYMMTLGGQTFANAYKNVVLRVLRRHHWIGGRGCAATAGAVRPSHSSRRRWPVRAIAPVTQIAPRSSGPGRSRAATVPVTLTTLKCGEHLERPRQRRVQLPAKPPKHAHSLSTCNATSTLGCSGALFRWCISKRQHWLWQLQCRLCFGQDGRLSHGLD